MEQERPTDSEQLIQSQREITEMVVAALLCVYDSRADMNPADIANIVQENTGYPDESCTFVIQRLYEEETPHLQMSKDPARKTMLSAVGLWFIEDSFMHGEENVDSMSIAERNLGKFFSFLKS